MKTNYIPVVWNRGFAPLVDLHDEVDRLFDNVWGTLPDTRNQNKTESRWTPPCDIEENSSHYLLTLDMPGVQKEHVRLEVGDNQLTVSGERNTERKSSSEGLSYSERRQGRFERTFRLPPGVDTGKVEAHYQDGTLRVYIPKAETVKPRQIKITNGPEAGFLRKLLGQSSEANKEDLRSTSNFERERAAS